MTVYFMNNGEFDMAAMTTFGVSAKECDNPIGQFGTGFKYAVAVILRLGGKISIKSLGKTYDFTTERSTIRNKEFNIVKINGESIGVTTHFGKNWEPWMAYRELFCNAKDEGGIRDTRKQKYDTIISVDCPEIEEVYNSHEKYFLEGEPLFTSAGVEVHKNSNDKLFYQGIRAYELRDTFNYTYNITDPMSLSEERVLRWPWMGLEKIARCIRFSEDVNYIRTLLDDNDSEIRCVDGDGCTDMSDTFLNEAKHRMRTKQGLPENIRTLLVRKDIKEANFKDIKLRPMQTKSYQRAVDFLKTIGIAIEDYPVRFVEGLGRGVMGRALNGEILIAETTLQMGVKQLASTLMEEWVHITEGCNDFDRNMQNWLFDKILSLGEELNQEIL